MPRVDAMVSQHSSRIAWRMVLIGFLAINISMGMTWGTFGPILPMFEREFEASRTVVSSAFGLIYLTLGLASPLTGYLVQRFSLRKVMIAGAVMNVAGNAALAFVDHFSLVMWVYAILIGPGICLVSAIPVTTLITRWFANNRGKGLGVANMLILLLISPPIATELILMGGRQALFLSLAACFMLLLPCLGFIIDRPPDCKTVQEAALPAKALMLREFLADKRFWLISLGVGFMSGAASIFAVHAVSIAISKGVDISAASILVSAFATGSLLGGPVFGWLADRIGPLAALAVNGAVLAGTWLLVFYEGNGAVLIGLSFVIGTCLGALVALHGLALGHVFGTENVGRALGYSYFLKIPFLFGSAPLVGLMYDSTKSYGLGLLMVSAALTLSTLIFTGIALGSRRSRQAQAKAG